MVSFITTCMPNNQTNLNKSAPPQPLLYLQRAFLPGRGKPCHPTNQGEIWATTVVGSVVFYNHYREKALNHTVEVLMKPHPHIIHNMPQVHMCKLMHVYTPSVDARDAFPFLFQFSHLGSPGRGTAHHSHQDCHTQHHKHSRHCRCHDDHCSTR